MAYGFKDLAVEVLVAATAPMTPAEIWAEAKRRGLDAKLGSHGKTPWESLGAALYTDAKGPAPRFAAHEGKPKRFSLRQPHTPETPKTTPTPTAADAPRYTFIECAKKVLETFANRQPMHYLDITQKALEQGWLRTDGKTPEASLYAQVLTHVKRSAERGETSPFVQLGKGMLALAEWQGNSFTHAIRKHNASVREALRERLLEMPSADFEDLIRNLFAEMGFLEPEVTPFSHDGGIDVRGVWEISEGVRQRYAVQVKRWAKNVQAPVVQQVRGSLKNGELGLIVTTSDFSKGAYAEARDETKHSPISLINGEQLVRLLIRHGIGVKSASIEVLELDERYARHHAKTSL